MLEKRNELLAEKIVTIFRQGLILTDSVVDFIQSTFSNPSFYELKDIISTGNDDEKDALIELVFFPDESVQLQIEEILSDGFFAKSDIEKITKKLVERKVEATIIDPVSGDNFRTVVTEYAAKQFVSRLNIAKKIASRVSESICQYVQKNYQTCTRVMLRNSRCNFNSDKTIFFLCAYFRKMITDKHQFFSCLDFLLQFLDEIEDDKDIFHSLMKKKMVLCSMLMKAGQFELQLGKNNIETLMLKGVKIPYINRNDVLKKIEAIDIISIAVFGKTENFHEAVKTIKFRKNG